MAPREGPELRSAATGNRQNLQKVLCASLVGQQAGHRGASSSSVARTEQRRTSASSIVQPGPIGQVNRTERDGPDLENSTAPGTTGRSRAPQTATTCQVPGS